MISAEQQFAEKLHSYTRPRPGANSRVKDLVDMVLLIENGAMRTGVLRKAVARTFAVHGSHGLPSFLQDPPAFWTAPFRKMARECGITDELGTAVVKVRGFCAVRLPRTAPAPRKRSEAGKILKRHF